MRPLLIVAGTRPEVIKLAPVMENLERLDVEYLFIWSGQHYDYELSKVFFEELGVREPVEDLGVGSGSHAKQTADCMVGVESAIKKYSPSIVIAQGDTNTVLASALASAKTLTPFAHVEAGMRSWDMRMPEEINRRVAGSIASLHFAPTKLAAINLLFEGISRDSIYLSGDTLMDVLHRYIPHARRVGEQLLSELGLERGGFVLATVHRAENTDDPERLENIMAALQEISRKYYKVVFPMHPRTRKAVMSYGLDKYLEGLVVLNPLGYFEFQGLLMNSRVVVTDSGGVQEEAFALKIPTVTLRYNTEWPETTIYGINRLAGAEKERIVRLVKEQANRVEELKKLNIENLLGDGKAGERISRVLKEYLERGLTFRDPDFRENPIVTYALLRGEDKNVKILDILAYFDENGRPSIRASKKLYLARILLKYYDDRYQLQDDHD